MSEDDEDDEDEEEEEDDDVEDEVDVEVEDDETTGGAGGGAGADEVSELDDATMGEELTAAPSFVEKMTRCAVFPAGTVTTQN